MNLMMTFGIMSKAAGSCGWARDKGALERLYLEGPLNQCIPSLLFSFISLHVTPLLQTKKKKCLQCGTKKSEIKYVFVNITVIIYIF